ncbi:MAG: OadG family protein [Pseudomonadales bacterium]
MEVTLLEQGLELMLIGMGAVFVFLTTLVGGTSLMSWLVQRFTPGADSSGEVADEEIAAIGAAIAQHRRK